MGAHWADISGELPDFRRTPRTGDPLDPNTIYLATDIGVFRSTSAGQAWESFSLGMPPALALGFSSHPSGVVQVATYGRGAYELGGGGSETDFSIAFAPTSLILARGAKQALTAGIVRASGFTERVSLVAPNASAQKLKVRVASVRGDSSTFKVTVKAKKSAAAGAYDLVFTGRSSSGILHTAALHVVVQ